MQAIPFLPAAPRILVADDDFPLLRWISAALRASGYDVVACHNGEKLLEALGSALLRREHVDLVISDVRMPGFSGVQVLEGLHRARRHTPIVLMTAFPDGLQARVGTSGPVWLLEKPFEIDDLLTIVVRATRSHHHPYPPRTTLPLPARLA